MISCMERYSEQFLDICKKDFICTGYVCGVCAGGEGHRRLQGMVCKLAGQGASRRKDLDMPSLLPPSVARG